MPLISDDNINFFPGYTSPVLTPAQMQQDGFNPVNEQDDPVPSLTQSEITSTNSSQESSRCTSMPMSRFGSGPPSNSASGFFNIPGFDKRQTSQQFDILAEAARRAQMSLLEKEMKDL